MPRTPYPLFVASVVLVAGLFPTAANAREDAKLEEREGVVKSVDTATNRVVLVTGEDKSETVVDVGAKTEFVVARRAGKLADLKEGMTAKVFVREGEKTAVKVEAGWPPVDLDVVAADTKRYTLMLKVKGKNEVEFDAEFTVAPDAVIEIGGIPAGLGDVTPNTAVRVEFTADKRALARVDSDGEAGELAGTVKAVDTSNKSVTLTVVAVGLRGERAVELSYAVSGDCTVRLAGKDVTLGDLKADMPVRCRFALDRRTISGMWAGPPQPKEGDK